MKTIFISARKRNKYRCPCCGEECKPICYEARMYNHVDGSGFQQKLVVTVPKLGCDNCHQTPQVRFPMAEPRVRYTKMYAREVLGQLLTNTRYKVATMCGVSVQVINGILKHSVKDAVVNQDLSYVNTVYVDETQFGHGQDYISVFADQNHKVIYACVGHASSVLESFCSHLIIQGGDPDNVRVFSADMSTAFESGIMSVFKNAVLVWDRFHLVKSINEGLNDVRKRLVKAKTEGVIGSKYLVLTSFVNASQKQKEDVMELHLNAPELAAAYDMKEAFLRIIKMPDKNMMITALKWWIGWVIESGPAELVRRAKRFQEKMDRIVAWTDHPISNSVCEGINKNIQDIRRQACGYQNVQNFFDMILLRQGNLTFRF